MFAHEKVTDHISRYRIPLLAGTVFLGGVYLFTHYGDNYAVMPAVNCIPAVVYGWSACLTIIGCMKKWGNTMPAFTSFLSKRSFGLYVFQYLPLSATAYALRNFTSISPLFIYLLTGLATFAGSLLLYEIISRIPVLRWCILGRK